VFAGAERFAVSCCLYSEWFLFNGTRVPGEGKAATGLNLAYNSFSRMVTFAMILATSRDNDMLAMSIFTTIPFAA